MSYVHFKTCWDMLWCNLELLCPMCDMVVRVGAFMVWVYVKMLWSRCMCIYVKMCFCPWCNIYQSMKKICNSAAHFFTKTGVKLQRTQISKGKIARVMLSFRNKVNNVNCSSENRGRGYLSFEITGVKSQSWKNRGKITIRVHSRGKITNLPNFLT
jgi:hypothetical protein